MMYVDTDGHLVYDHNAFTDHTVVRSPSPLPVGSFEVTVSQERVSGGPARASLLVDGSVVSSGIIAFVPAMVSPVGMDIGRNLSGISDAYTAPFDFTGSIVRVDVETKPAMSPDDEFAVALRAALATQ